MPTTLPPLHAAARRGDAAEITHILEANLRTDVDSIHLRMTPLHHATMNGHAAAVEALLKAGADPHKMTAHEWIEPNLRFSGREKVYTQHSGVPVYSPLGLAARKSHPDVVLLLWRHGAEIDNSSYRNEYTTNRPRENHSGVRFLAACTPATEDRDKLIAFCDWRRIADRMQGRTPEKIAVAIAKAETESPRRKALDILTDPEITAPETLKAAKKLIDPYPSFTGSSTLTKQVNTLVAAKTHSPAPEFECLCPEDPDELNKNQSLVRDPRLYSVGKHPFDSEIQVAKAYLTSCVDVPARGRSIPTTHTAIFSTNWKCTAAALAQSPDVTLTPAEKAKLFVTPLLGAAADTAESSVLPPPNRAEWLEEFLANYLFAENTAAAAPAPGQDYN